MKRDRLVVELDAYFRVAEVENDAPWGEMYDELLGAPYWREFTEPAYERRWNGLMVRGAADVERVATCVFPSDEIVSSLAPRTFLFSEHPIDDAPGDLFTPLSRSSFETMRERGISFYNVHGPLDQHPEVSPSRLLAGALGIKTFEEYDPMVDGIPGGAAVIGQCALSLDDAAAELRDFLGREIPVRVLSRPRERSGRMAIAAGGGAQRSILEVSLERGCETYVTGNAASPCPIPEVRSSIEDFNRLAAEEGVAVIDGTHYGTEIPPQRRMAEWFRAKGLHAEFIPGRPERD